MAKKKSRADEVVDMLRARGIRKQVATQIAEAATSTRKRTPKQVLDLLGDLRKLADEMEDRLKGGPSKRKAAGKKAAATRKRASAKRSAAAKKGAQTRAKSSSRSTTAKAKRTASRAKAKAS